jgi:cytochrome c oxidase subunit 3
MNDPLVKEENKVQLEKAKKSLVYVGILSVIMLFGAMTSAYIVSMGDSFWLKFPLPKAFWISTAVILISSIFLQIAVRSARKGNKKTLKLAISITFILGVSFIYFQFKGYGQLVKNGVHATGNYILVTNGRYGDYFEVKYKGDFIEINGNDYLIKGQKMSPAQIIEYQDFMSQFEVVNEKEPFKVRHYGEKFLIYFENTPLQLKNKILVQGGHEELNYVDRVRLRDLALNVRDLRGDFFVRGEMGKDFHIYYKGEELHYQDRELRLNGKPLSNYLQIKSMESADTSSSYLYIITFLHLLHVIVTMFYMSKLVIHSFIGKINQQNNIAIRTGAIFWHFLGLLWLYLLLFLLFIH